MKKTYLTSCVLQYFAELHLIVILFVLCILTFFSFYFVIALFLYLYLIRHSLNVLFLILPFFLLGLFSLRFFEKLDDATNLKGECYIVDINRSETIIKYQNKLYVAYNLTYDLVPGDICYIEASSSIIRPPLQSFSFDTSMYLKINRYRQIINVKKLSFISHKYSFNETRYYIKSFYRTKLDPSYFSLFNALVFADNDLSDIFNESFSALNMMHILAISGFHLMLLFKFIYYLLFRTLKRPLLAEDITLVILFSYSFLCGFKIPVTRAFLFLLITKINQRKSNHLTSLNIWSLVFILQILFNPLSILSLSFIFTYLASFFILFLREFSFGSNCFKREFITSILFFLLLFPFITKTTNKLSLFFLLSFLITPLFSTFIIPLNYLIFCVPSLNLLVNNVILYVLNELSKLSNIFVLRLPYMNLFFTTLYYINFIFSLLRRSFYQKSYLHLLLNSSFICLFLLKPLVLIPSVTFINVGQGDACLIKDNGKVSLIDAFNTYDYLLKNGIYEIDSILITHSDKDHLGDLEKIIKEWNVKNIYYSKYDKRFNDLGFTGVGLKKGDIFRLCNKEIKVLSPDKEYKSVNDLSLTFYYEFYNKSILFTGDISSLVEDDLVKQNLLKPCDILKVAHHGSNTSSSLAFLNLVRPRLSICSAGYKNRYLFPHYTVVNNLRRYGNVLITYLHQNITIYKNRVKYKTV